MATYMYVSLQDDDKVSIFGVDPGTGKLTPNGEVSAAGGPSASAISPDRKVFYVGHRTSKEISSFGINPDTGGLTLIGRVPVPDSPTYLSPRPQRPVPPIRLLSGRPRGGTFDQG